MPVWPIVQTHPGGNPLEMSILSDNQAIGCGTVLITATEEIGKNTSFALEPPISV